MFPCTPVQEFDWWAGGEDDGGGSGAVTVPFPIQVDRWRGNKRALDVDAGLIAPVYFTLAQVVLSLAGGHTVRRASLGPVPAELCGTSRVDWGRTEGSLFDFEGHDLG